MEISRWCKYTSFSDIVELHFFSDSSSFAYGADVCLQIVTTDSIYCSFFMDKGRLSPIRNKTINISQTWAASSCFSCKIKDVNSRRTETKHQKCTFMEWFCHSFKVHPKWKCNFWTNHNAPSQYKWRQLQHLRLTIRLNNSNIQDWTFDQLS